MDTPRTTFTTARAGLDTRSLPMRLFQKAKRLGTWDPAMIDFEQDRRDWQGLGPREQDLLLRLTLQFQSGEESVTYDLLPLLQVMADQGRIEDELFLTSYLWEEAKHLEGFTRFLAALGIEPSGAEAYYTAAYRSHFFEAQPRAMARLRTDGGPMALAEAVVTYQMMTEGVLAETGYHAYYTVLEAEGLMPGMQRLTRLIQRDESRHIAYGVYLLSRLVAEHGDALWEAIEARLNALLPVAMAHVAQTLAPYGDDIPFGLTPDLFLNYALGQFQKRHAHIERARGQTLEQVLYG